MSFAGFYTPTKVAAFGTPKNSDINANLNAIQAAFNAQNAWIYATSGLNVPSSGSQNIAVDLTNVNPGNNVVINLPASPAVGDPPIRIVVIAAAPLSNQNASSALINGNGNAIYGIVSGFACPALVNAGDEITFQYIGGATGWIYLSYNVSPLASTLAQPWHNVAGGGSTSNLFHRAELNITTTGTTAVNILGINSPGLSAAITRNGGIFTIGVGSGAQTYNGTPGTFVINTTGTRYLFTCIGVNAFSVTT